MEDKSIAILGAGIGGIVCADKLRGKLGDRHRIILIDKSENHVFYPSLLWLIFGKREKEDIQRSFKILEKKGIEFIQGEVREISTPEKSVMVGGEKIKYDYLVIALGAELNKKQFPKTPKIYDFYCLEGALLVRDELKKFSGGKIVVLISKLPFKCPAAPYELALLMDSFFKAKGTRGKVEIDIYTPETLPMPVIGPKLGMAIKKILEKREVGLHTNYKFRSVDEEKVVFENGEEAKFDLLLYVPPHTAPEVVEKSGLTDETGWIPVNMETLKTRHENVYAIGDVTGIKLPGKYEENRPLNLPKAGVFAHFQAEVVAENITKRIRNEPERKKFSGDGYCFLEIGNFSAGVALGNFYKIPNPTVVMLPPLPLWHLAKVLFEKYWFWTYY